MDSVFALLILIFLYFEETKRDPFDRENTKALKGICAMAIVFRHLLGAANAVIVSKLFANGFLYVAVFFLISGYGYSLSLIKKKNNALLIQRLIKIVIPFGIVTILRTILYVGCGFEHDFGKIKLGTYVPYSWYVYAIILFYVVYYFVSLINKRVYRIMLFGVGLIVYVYTCAFALNNVGISWYMAVAALWLGTILGEYQEIRRAVVEHCSTIIIICAVGYSIFIRLYDWQNIDSCILQNFTVVFFAILMLMLSAKVNVVNKFTTYLGGISYEIYLIQGLVSYIVYKYVNIASSTLMIGMVVLLDILVAYCINVMDKKVIRSISKYLLEGSREEI